MIFHDFHQFRRQFEDFTTLASPSHRLLGSLSTVVARAYFTNEARTGRKITGKSSSFDPAWVLWGLEQTRDHSEPIPCRYLDLEKKLSFFKDFNKSTLNIKQLGVRSQLSPQLTWM